MICPRTDPELILASGSPRRADLLREMGISFVIRPAQVEELSAEAAGDITPHDFALANARLKADAAYHDERYHAAKDEREPLPVLGCDTVVALGGAILGKPADLAQARDYLHQLSGHRHTVLSGVALITPEHALHEFVEATYVEFRELSDVTIETYLHKVDVLDKAGAYAIQQHGDMLVSRVEGCVNSVIGLPTHRLATLPVEPFSFLSQKT